MTFRGWPAAAVEFFEGLEADNTRSYWHARKPVYDDMVRGPMEALIAELEPEFGTGRVFKSAWQSVNTMPTLQRYAKAELGSVFGFTIAMQAGNADFGSW